MVERADEAPLLFWAEGPAVSAPPPAAEADSGGGGRRLGGGWSAGPWGDAGPAEAAGPPRTEAEEDQIVAVFVVTFDPRTGERRRGRAGRGAGDRGLQWSGLGSRCRWGEMDRGRGARGLYRSSRGDRSPPAVRAASPDPSGERPAGAGLYLLPRESAASRHCCRSPVPRLASREQHADWGPWGFGRKRNMRGVAFGLHVAEKF